MFEKESFWATNNSLKKVVKFLILVKYIFVEYILVEYIFMEYVIVEYILAEYSFLETDGHGLNKDWTDVTWCLHSHLIDDGLCFQQNYCR